MPSHRLDAVTDGFSNATGDVKRLICEHGEKLTVDRCRNYVDNHGQWKIEGCHYNETEKMIRMDECLDDDSYADIFRHEMGHFTDDQIGRPSLSEEFAQAIEADSYWYDPNTDSGSANLQRMLSDLQSSSAYYCHHYSDILSGVFRNNDMVRNAWEDNGDACWGHKDEYWNGSDGPAHAVEREVFANLFAIYAENDLDTVSFVEKAFPNTTTRFKSMIGGA